MIHHLSLITLPHDPLGQVVQAAHDPQGHRIRPAGALLSKHYVNMITPPLFSLLFFYRLVLKRDDAVVYLAHYHF